MPRSFLTKVLPAPAFAVMLSAMLVAGSLSACASLDQSLPDPSLEPTPAVTDPPRRVRGEGTEGTEGNGSSLQRRLSELLSAVSGGLAEPTAHDDGYVPDGASISPFEGEHAAIANLDPVLLEAIQRAALDARHEGIEIRISSGWRSARYQQFLLDNAVKRYGSEEEARRFVNTPEQSTHVTGTAVDIAPMDAMSWLSQRGAAYGLCQTYANEMWHYELMTEPDGTCPPQLSDAGSG